MMRRTSADMTDEVLKLLRYGGRGENMHSLSFSTAAPFLPSLALLASDSADLIPRLLPSLCSHRQVPRALAYASLDYVEIARAVLQSEEENEAAPGRDVTDGNAAMELQRGEVPGEEEDAKKLQWKWENEDENDVVDESYAFEMADEKERAKLAIISVRKRARENSVRLVLGVFNKEASQHQETEKHQGSIWSNEACLAELLCLLPVAVSRCPVLLSPEVLVEGLMSASSGGSLLVATFVNNPSIAERGVSAIANILSRENDTNDHHGGSPPTFDSMSTGKSAGGSGPISGELRASQPHEFASSLTSALARRATLVLVNLCQIAPSFAAQCREALVNACTLAELALQVTLDIFHDELQFLSKLIFTKERTSRWIIGFLGANQKNGDSQQHVPAPSRGPRETDSSTKGPPVTQAIGNGVGAKVRESLLADAMATWKREGWCGKVYAHLRLYCVLIRVGDLSPTHEEVDFWIKILGETPDRSSGELRFVSERTLQLGICFVSLVPGLSSPSTKTLLHACIVNLLRATMGSAPYAACTPEVELAVWVAVQLLIRRFADIAGLVREVLGMHVTVHTASMRDLADAAMAGGVLSDPAMAASAAAALRPCGPIPSCRRSQYLGLKCLELLLSQNIFTRCTVDISDTVMHYICIAGEPIHSALPSVVFGFTEASVTAPRPRGGLSRFRIRPFSRASLVQALAPGLAILRASSSSSKAPLMSSKNPSRMRVHASSCNGEKHQCGDPMATLALATYYILCREQILRSMGIPSGSNNDNSGSFGDGVDDKWWTDLLADLPLLELFTYMEANWPAYEHLLPQWLRVASVIFPERFTARALLQDLEKTSNSFETRVEGVVVTEDLDWVVGPSDSTSVVSSKDAAPAAAPLVEGGPLDQKKSETEPSTNNIQTKGSSITAMDIDRDEQQEVAVAKVGVDNKQGVKAESPTKHVSAAESVATLDLLSPKYVTKVMTKALESPLLALRTLEKMKSSQKGKGRDLEDMEAMAGIGADWQLEAAMMRGLVPNLLDNSCPRCLQDEFCAWWRMLPSTMGKHLVPVLWDLIRDQGLPANGHSFALSGDLSNAQSGTRSVRNGPKPVVTLSSSGLVEEPLKLLACDERVFRCPLLGIVLDILLELLVANRRICQLAASDGGREGIKRDEVAAAMVAQDSAVCQILLEACLPINGLDDESRPGPLLEARSSICATICEMLYRSPLLFKLLHFQGYDIRLIPMMVEGVPVMVQCLDFIGELLQQPQQERQVFAVNITAHLTSLHPDLPQSLTAAQQVVGQVTQMRAKVAGCADYLQEVLGAVAQCASTFPSLAPQVVVLLQSCVQAGGPLTRSGPPRDAALHATAIAAFKYLVQGKLLHGRPPPASSDMTDEV